MNVVPISLIAQVVCLISLCWSSEEPFFYFWYLPNYLGATLVLLPSINPEYSLFFFYVASSIILGNFVVTALSADEGVLLDKPWVSANPAAVSSLLALALDVYA